MYGDHLLCYNVDVQSRERGTAKALFDFYLIFTRLYLVFTCMAVARFFCLGGGGGGAVLRAARKIFGLLGGLGACFPGNFFYGNAHLMIYGKRSTLVHIDVQVAVRKKTRADENTSVRVQLGLPRFTPGFAQ